MLRLVEHPSKAELTSQFPVSTLVDPEQEPMETSRAFGTTSGDISTIIPSALQWRAKYSAFGWHTPSAFASQASFMQAFGASMDFFSFYFMVCEAMLKSKSSWTPSVRYSLSIFENEIFWIGSLVSKVDLTKKILSSCISASICAAASKHICSILHLHANCSIC